MNLQPVKSSGISHIAHDPQRNVLSIKFTNGALWHYDNVPADAHTALMSAESIGKHFAANIRNKYSARRG